MISKNVFILAFIQILLCIPFVSSQFVQTTTPLSLPPQCYSYSTIDDPSRNVNANGYNQCDVAFMSGTTWYRFVGSSGTQIPTTATSPNLCNTQVTGWYAGMMPSVSQTINDGRVCFSWDNNVCQWSNTIGVTNCGSYYVYRLTVPPVCAARYCTETVSTPMTTTSIPDPFPQCSNYTTINDPTRNVNYGSSSGRQDQLTFSSDPKWVRFEGTGGTIIPTSVVPYYHCGTSATGWYAGQMPTDAYSTTNGLVCFAWTSNNCSWNTSIQVTNCGSYYVYHLCAPPISNLRYCTDIPRDSLTTTITTVTTQMITLTTPTIPAQCTAYRTINDSTRHVNYTLSYQCDQNFLNANGEWVRFEGPGGTQIPTSSVVVNRCGSSATGWYRDEMPNTPYTTTNGTVCFNWSSNTCNWSTQIQVTHCGSYYVYHLERPPVCTLRYCTVDP